jgi:hypothetical protein
VGADPVTFRRLKGLVDLEVVHRAWGCAILGMERLGQITKDQREAGDRYQKLHQRFMHIHMTEPDSDQDYLKVERIKERYGGAWDLLGYGRDGYFIRTVTHALCVDDAYPCTEADKARAKKGLSRLEVFFAQGRPKKIRGGTNSERQGSG